MDNDCCPLSVVRCLKSKNMINFKDKYTASGWSCSAIGARYCGRRSIRPGCPGSLWTWIPGASTTGWKWWTTVRNCGLPSAIPSGTKRGYKQFTPGTFVPGVQYMTTCLARCRGASVTRPYIPLSELNDKLQFVPKLTSAPSSGC